MMSAKLSAGSCLEGTPTISVYVGPQAIGLDWLCQQVDLTTKQLSQAPLQGAKGEEPYAGFRIQLGGKINVTIDVGIIAGDGTKQRQTTDAGPAQFRLVRSQGGDDVLGQVGCGRRAHRRVSGANNSTKLHHAVLRAVRTKVSGSHHIRAAMLCSSSPTALA
jgi:hypothetical protein